MIYILNFIPHSDSCQTRRPKLYNSTQPSKTFNLKYVFSISQISNRGVYNPIKMAQSASPRFHIKPASTTQDLVYTKELFTAYANSLPISLTFQNFAAELASLPGLYAPPTGAIFLAFLTPQSSTSLIPSNQENSTPIGVIALRPLPNSSPRFKICEMKRLYLSPASRGLGIAKN